MPTYWIRPTQSARADRRHAPLRLGPARPRRPAPAAPPIPSRRSLDDTPRVPEGPWVRPGSLPREPHRRRSLQMTQPLVVKMDTARQDATRRARQTAPDLEATRRRRRPPLRGPRAHASRHPSRGAARAPRSCAGPVFDHPGVGRGSDPRDDRGRRVDPDRDRPYFSFTRSASKSAFFPAMSFWYAAEIDERPQHFVLHARPLGGEIEEAGVRGQEDVGFRASRVAMDRR